MPKNLPEEKHSRLWLAAVRENDSVQGSYLVREKRMGTTRSGEPFISLVLADRTAEVEAKVWERAEELSGLFQQGEVIEIEGRAGSYRGRIQITVSRLGPATERTDPALFLESSAKDPAAMLRSLRGLLRDIRQENLKALVERFLNDRRFVSLFKQAPAAKNFHHGYLGGLLEHTLSVCRMSQQAAEQYPELDRDLLMTGAFLHDIGKIRELIFDLHIDYSDEGRLLGHLVLGVAMLDEKLAGLKTFPDELAIRLKHMLLSHHGEYEFGSPKRPKFLEAYALHLIDDLDAKMNGLSRFMERDRREGTWTDFNRLFERYFLKGKTRPLKTETEPGAVVDEKQASLFSS
jgi:3'-5' exoribonuclease